MEINNEQEAIRIFGRLIEKVLPSIMLQYMDNIRIGKIISFSEKARRANVEVFGSGNILKGIRFSKGITSINTGDICLIVSPDPKLKNQNFIVGIY